MELDEAWCLSNEVWAELGYDTGALPPTLKVVHLIGWLEYELARGGILGWLIRMGEYAPETVSALEPIGAPRCASVLREVTAVFPRGRPSAEDLKHLRGLMAAKAAAGCARRDLGHSHSAGPEDVYARLQAVRRGARGRLRVTGRVLRGLTLHVGADASPHDAERHALSGAVARATPGDRDRTPSRAWPASPASG